MSQFKTERSAGFIIFKRNGILRFLFLKRRGNFDIPKGLINPGEDELSCAFRELREETGIDDVKVIPGFKKQLQYYYRRENSLIRKQVVYFLGETAKDEVRISKEHDGYSWMTKEEINAQVRHKNLVEAVSNAEKLVAGQGS